MQLEEKSKQMSEEMDTAISNLNKEASDLEVEKGRKAVSWSVNHIHYIICSISLVNLIH